MNMLFIGLCGNRAVNTGPRSADDPHNRSTAVMILLSISCHGETQNHLSFNQSATLQTDFHFSCIATESRRRRLAEELHTAEIETLAAQMTER